ncbi:MAG: MBL fold metallo-hydrolase [Caldilineaceae bacterium]|nr:MBL fold metallo-hydrolase [Caldilineaceae bacterium]
MIQVEQHGPVTAIRMARAFLGRPLEWTAAFYVDGVLIDTGPRRTAGELTRVLRNVTVDQIVVTHGYEDHTGGLAALMRRYPHAGLCRPRTLPLLQQPERIDMPRYRRFIWGRPEPVQHALPLDDLGDRIFRRTTSFASWRHRATRATTSASSSRRNAGSSAATRSCPAATRPLGRVRSLCHDGQPAHPGRATA